MSNGCWTCRDRKVRCDLGLPTCANCSQARRHCLGYGLRLAWPRAGNKQRAIVSAPSATNGHATKDRIFKDLFLVNVSSDDVHLFYQISNSKTTHKFARSHLPISNTWSYHNSVVMHKPVSRDLIAEQETSVLDYYIKFGSHFFGSLRGDVLAPLLLKIATTDTSRSSKAVLHALLALSCLHLRRDAEALAYRASAIALLSGSLRAGSEAKVAFQNIATSMLLCMFETYRVSETSANWAVYLCGVKHIVLDSLLQQKIRDEEYIALKDWVYFYEVLARFSLLHWVAKPQRQKICHEVESQSIQPVYDALSQDEISTVGYSKTVFQSIAAITEFLLTLDTSRRTSVEHQKQVNEVEGRLRSFRQEIATNNRSRELSDDERLATESTIIIDLYLLAASIYLNRTAINYSGEEPPHRRLVDQALSYLSKVPVWKAPWPFFIIGCEAQTDSQRRQVLQLIIPITHAEAEGHLDKVLWIQRMIEASWNQDDLQTAEQGLDYITKISAVISASPFLPLFA